MLPPDEFVRFNNADNSDSCLDVAMKERQAVTDDRAREIIYKISDCQTITEFQDLDEKKKARFVKKIHEKGVSVRQLSRLIGTTKGMVEKWIKG